MYGKPIASIKGEIDSNDFDQKHKVWVKLIYSIKSSNPKLNAITSWNTNLLSSFKALDQSQTIYNNSLFLLSNPSS